MPKKSFNIYNYVLGELRIETQDIRGRGSFIYPYLEIPVYLSLKPLKIQGDKFINYTIIYI